MKQVPDKFWQKVQKTATCWLWQGTRHADGYGTFGGTFAHRYMFASLFGPIETGLKICHTCDVRQCVNPNHLVATTHLKNMSDAKRKGHFFNQSLKACMRGHRYTNKNTYRSPKSGKRLCRSCQKIRRNSKTRLPSLKQPDTN